MLLSRSICQITTYFAAYILSYDAPRAADEEGLHKECDVKKRIKAGALVAALVVMGCATYPVATTVVTQPGRKVTAEASKFSFLWLSPLPMETTSELLDDILEQCEGADLTGVTVGTERAWVVVGETMKIIVSGYCVEPNEGAPGGGT
jgi:hypothetical protein